MYLYQKASTFCVKSVKMPFVRVNLSKCQIFCVNSVKFTLGKIYTNMFVGFDKYQVRNG